MENTLVVFFTDHGISHVRGKQVIYDEGAHIPLVIRGPGVGRSEKRTDLVEHIDVAALSLAAAGIDIPDRMEGRDILAGSYNGKSAVFAARDRCGEAADRIRSVRTDSYLYIKNFYPERPFLMPSEYKDNKLILQRLHELRAEGKVGELTEELLFLRRVLPKSSIFMEKTLGKSEISDLTRSTLWHLRNIGNVWTSGSRRRVTGALNRLRSTSWRRKTRCSLHETRSRGSATGRTRSST